MSEIKLPVKYDERTEAIYDADGNRLFGCPFVDLEKEEADTYGRYLADAINEFETLKAQVADNGKTFNKILNNFWLMVYPDQTDWEYPAQVIRHVQDFIDEKDAEIAELRAENLSLRSFLAELDEVVEMGVIERGGALHERIKKEMSKE